MPYNAKGVAYVSCQWTLTLLALVIVPLRVYSRSFLTRSFGSDDFFIIIPLVLETLAAVWDLKAFLNGWSQHQSTLTSAQYAAEQKWEFIGYVQVYISYFFVRASVMLFVLRLLPSYKRWQQRVIYMVFLVSFFATAYTCITFGVSCIPFKANWEDVPGSKCFSKDFIVITNQVNAALSCVCDIATALIPLFLLWDVKMRKRTKRQLNALFGLSLITAALSIGRAATTTKKNLTEDPTWNLVPTYYFNMFEIRLGIIFACAPAIRQFWAYRKRTKSSLPTKHRQYPNEDFEKMRYRINLRDLFWYRKAPMVGDRVHEAARIFQSKTPPPDASSGDPQSSSEVSHSALDAWEKRIKNFMGSGRNHEHTRLESSEDSNSNPKPSEKYHLPATPRPSDIPPTLPPIRHRWTWWKRQSDHSSSSSNQAPFLISNSDTDASIATMSQDESFLPFHSNELASEPPNSKAHSTDGSYKNQGPNTLRDG